MSVANRLLVVGASSAIGGEVSRSARLRGLDVVGTSRSGGGVEAWVGHDLLRDPPERLLECRPTHAIVLAAESSIAACEREPQRTRRVNVEGVAAVAHALAAGGVRVTVASSSSVFSGTAPLPIPSDRPDPVSEYGRQKRDLEAACLDADAVTVCRLTKVLAGPTIIQAWEASLRRGEPITAFANLAIAPLTGQAAAHGLLEAALAGQGSRIVHLSASDEVSYAQAAALVSEWAGADPRLVGQAMAPFDPGSGFLPARFAALGSPWWSDAFPQQSSSAAIRDYLRGTTHSASR